MPIFTIELRTMSRLVLALTAVFAVASRVEAQQQVYYQTVDGSGVVAAPTVAAPTYIYQTAQPVQQTQYCQPVQHPQYVQQPQYVQPAVQPQYYQSAYAGMEATAVQPVQAQAAAPDPAAASGDPYGFTSWLNGLRASYGLGAVGHDPNLSSWAAMNNDQQAARGLGHHVMGPARRQNSAMGGFPGIESMWMASPAHRAALLDPTITWIGIAGAGAWWTFNAN